MNRPLACVIGAVLIIAGCSSKSLIPCSDDAACQSFGAVCVDKVCRVPGEDGLDLSVGPNACAQDEGCSMASMPICDKMMRQCRACMPSDCFGLRPKCATEGVLAGACVECAQAADCANAGKTCGATGVCVACQRHTECESGICDAGVCAQSADILRVDNAQPCAGGDGSLAHPFCAIGAALGAPAEHAYILVAGSDVPYVGFTIPPARATPVMIVGPGLLATKKAAIVGNQLVRPVTMINAPSCQAVVIEGFDLNGDTDAMKDLVHCETSAALVVRSSHLGPALGMCVNAKSCTLTVEDSTFEGWQGRAIALAPDAGMKIVIQRNIFRNGKSTTIDGQGGIVTLRGNVFRDNYSGVTLYGTMYSIENNVVMNNGTTASFVIPAFELAMGSTGVFRYNTLINNQQGGAGVVGGVFCEGFTQTVSSSILIGNTLFNGSQVTNCTLNGVVTGTDSAPNAIQLTPNFVSATDAHLIKNDSANKACCVDKGASGPMLDADGAMRPQGKGWDYGAYEVE